MELDEIKHLKQVYGIICAEIEQREKDLSVSKEDILEQYKSLWESIYDIDSQERRAQKGILDLEERFYDQGKRELLQLSKLKNKAYFGRFGFIFEEDETPTDFYIGMFNLLTKDGASPTVYDWRTPVASLFYEDSAGKTSYRAPKGVVRGDLVLKRQYNIAEDKLISFADVASRVGDDILLYELSHAKDSKMKNIISTLQQEQNAIIRSNHPGTLIIQGAAGSGKTSVALHRVAYLLFNDRTRLRSRDIVILSPNRVFSSYISTVLPEMGEENIREAEFSEIARKVLGEKVAFETLAEFVERINQRGGDETVGTKFSYDFYKKFIDFAENKIKRLFVATDIYAEDTLIVSKEIVQKRFASAGALSVEQKCKEAAEDIWNYIDTGRRENRALLRKLEAALLGMTGKYVLTDIYNEFLQSVNLPAVRGKRLNFEDLAAYVYLSLKIKGNGSFPLIKQLIIDEMQDYSYLQYSIFSLLFPNAQKTILGDVNQSLNSFNGSVSAVSIGGLFPDSVIIHMNKSYRSTCEINALAKKILQNNDMQIVERHGKEPEFYIFDDRKEQIKYLSEKCNAFLKSDFKSLAILFKDGKSAKEAYEKLAVDVQGVCYLDRNSNGISNPIVVSSISCVKGLEFDAVIVADGNGIYSSDQDRRLLFVAVTRALHEVYIFAEGKPSPLFEDKS